MRISEKITNKIFEYNQLPLDGVNLNTLVHIRKDLVCLCYDFGREVSQYKIDFDRAYGKRKIDFFKYKNKYISEGLGKAEVTAESMTSLLRTKEKELEGLYSGSKIILTQANEVLRAMFQDISLLKQELKEG